MKNWGFSDAHGNSLARGWQGHESDARAIAQRYANERGEAVSFWDESLHPNDDETEVPSETVWPVGGGE